MEEEAGVEDQEEKEEEDDDEGQEQEEEEEEEEAVAACPALFFGANGFSSKSAANLVVDISTKHISRAPVKGWWVGE